MIKPKLYLKLSGSNRSTPRASSLSVEFLDHPGIFETMRAYGGRVLGLGEHVGRLFESATGAGQIVVWKRSDIERFVVESIGASGYREALVRLAVTFGPKEQAMVIFVRKFEPYTQERYDRGIEIRVAPVLKGSHKAVNPQIKSNQYVGAVMAYLQEPEGRPAAHGGFETLFLNRDGFLTEGTVSNLIIVKNRCVLTPAASSGILRGVTRSLVLDAAARLGLACSETMLTRHDLYNADEAFITKTLSELMPVVRCDGRRIGSGRRGEWTKKLHEEFRRLVDDRLARQKSKPSKRKAKR